MMASVRLSGARPVSASSSGSRQRSRLVVRADNRPLREYNEESGQVKASGSSGSAEAGKEDPPKFLYADENPPVRLGGLKPGVMPCMCGRVSTALLRVCAVRSSRHHTTLCGRHLTPVLVLFWLAWFALLMAAAPRHHEPRDEGAAAERVLRPGRRAQPGARGCAGRVRRCPLHHVTRTPALVPGSSRLLLTAIRVPICPLTTSSAPLRVCRKWGTTTSSSSSWSSPRWLWPPSSQGPSELRDRQTAVQLARVLSPDRAGKPFRVLLLEKEMLSSGSAAA